MWTSLAWKFVYGAVGTILAVATGYVNANPDPAAWTLTAFLGGLSIAAIAFVKKFLVNWFLPQ